MCFGFYLIFFEFGLSIFTLFLLGLTSGIEKRVAVDFSDFEDIVSSVYYCYCKMRLDQNSLVGLSGFYQMLWYLTIFEDYLPQLSQQQLNLL